MSETTGKTRRDGDGPDPREALLPWYATGHLDAGGRAAVEEWLAENPAARRQLELVGEEIDAALAAGDAIDPPSTRMLDRLMTDIDAIEGPRRAGGGALAGLLRGLTGWMPAQAPAGLRLAAVAAALVIVAQAATIGWMLTGGGAEPGHRTASGPVEAVATGPEALIAFQAGARAGDIAALLAAAGTDIVDGPREGGVFVIRFRSATMSDEDTAAAIAAIEARRDIVSLVARAR